ncbi:MAG: ribosomal-processing cysteine protease Prp [Clostridia bacterium]|nr:ribosomal-processing cysteine protease Prp [Clostridia bacterium]
MVKVKFYHSSTNAPTGFEISGHSGYDTHGNDIVCSAVSSAAYMTANTLIEIMKLPVSAEVQDGMMKISLPAESAAKANDILLGFRLHITELAKQYPKNVTITTTEV